MTPIAPQSQIHVPREVAVCPYCETPLHVQAHTWEQEDDGTWIATGIDLDCETEPDIDSDEWEEWFARHSVMPYVHMLPVRDKVLAWINERYRFEMEE